ncbi:DUF4376 domain-containing protein [Pseudomonas sp. RT6P73]
MSDKFVTFNQDGTLNHRLIEGVHAIPADATVVDEALWLRLTQETDGQWTIDAAGTIAKQPLPDIEQDVVQLIARTRFEHEAAGFIIDGLAIESTRDSQALIASAGLSALIDPDYRCNFKTANGFVEIGAVQILAIANAVRAHVQACFDRELALLRAIEAGTYSADMLNEGWPEGLSVPAPVEPK